ncbi:hypothetical protein GZH47_33105 (plasmid) [Paenibacillus rhizovicinus]|uniref:Uncharacterized protein n=1 Tax=Paenibacillus rhizovicinus TaxID=2704463 RepID=A0A6C0PCJ7_9BACL|nr:hypothetical protein [Paenibacillus rhizovicinus]QHW35733.1 hypothetical protein GZH47_33105 [Paenibacillus rhizovicinus]
MRDKICAAIDYAIDRPKLYVPIGILLLGIAIALGPLALVMFALMIPVIVMYFRWTLIEEEPSKVVKEEVHEEMLRRRRKHA